MPEQRHFARTRTITCPPSVRQCYFAADEDLWKNSRPDLADVRIYGADGHARPYALLTMNGRWMPVPSTVTFEEVPRQTEARLATSSPMPIERITLEVTDDQPDFRRSVIVRDADGQLIVQRQIEQSHSAVGFAAAGWGPVAINIPSSHRRELRLTVMNEDDQPLRIKSITASSIERRFFFQPAPDLRLFYGDAMVSRPIYDYAKFFSADPDAGAAVLGKPQVNPDYRPRDESGAWSERHPSLLWMALVIAVAGIALMALRQMRN